MPLRMLRVVKTTKTTGTSRALSSNSQNNQPIETANLKTIERTYAASQFTARTKKDKELLEI